MIIKSLSIDEETFNDMGIGFSELPLDKPLEMHGLGQMVVLAGPNGAGKSRLLRLIQKLAPKHLDLQAIDQLKHNIRQLTGGLDSWKASAESLNKQLTELGADEKVADQARQAGINVANIQNQIDQFEKQLKFSAVLSVDGAGGLRTVSFVPKLPKLVDPFHTTAIEADQRAGRLMHSVDDAETNAPAYAQRILRIAVEHGYERQEKGEQVITPAEKSRNELVELVKILLGSDIKIKLENSRLVIGDMASYSDALSPGQQVLFQFACLIHAQQTSLADCIVLMDEPENHLHPAVLTQVVDGLRGHLTHGQLWIATHSVPLIAQLMSSDRDCLWFVSGGRVKRSGRSPEIVLDSLMGGPDGSKHLQNLTLLPAQYAGIRFLTECIDAPGVVGPDVKDPQTRQITRIIRKRAGEKKASGDTLRILDFGAGKGRLLATLRSDFLDASSWLDYYAYDVDNSSQSECEQEIGATYVNDSKPRWFSDLHALEANLGTNSIDIVILCNVLHEINPDDWLRLFSKDSVLHNLLNNDGYVLVVEDYGIPVGERAHRYGFLLLDEPELCKLFEVTAEDRKNGLFVSQSSADSRYLDRLKAHLVGKSCVEKISGDTRKNAVIKLHDRMLEVVDDFLQQKSASEGADGRAYARSAQLVANTSSWIKVNGNN